jgi:small conductance mechanosensitive channel
MVRLRELGGSSIDFVVRVWTKASDYWEVYYDITEAIYKKLPEKGISFPFQQFDVHIKN